MFLNTPPIELKVKVAVKDFPAGVRSPLPDVFPPIWFIGCV
jgi:hypothetical protein